MYFTTRSVFPRDAVFARGVIPEVRGGVALLFRLTLSLCLGRGGTGLYKQKRLGRAVTLLFQRERELRKRGGQWTAQVFRKTRTSFSSTPSPVFVFASSLERHSVIPGVRRGVLTGFVCTAARSSFRPPSPASFSPLISFYLSRYAVSLSFFLLLLICLRFVSGVKVRGAGPDS